MINPSPSFIQNIRSMTGLTETQIIGILIPMIERTRLNFMRAESVEIMLTVNAANMFTNGSNMEDMLRVQKLLQNMTKWSMSMDISGAQEIDGVSNMVSDASNKFFTRYGEEIKNEVNNILQDTIKGKGSRNDAAYKIDEYFKNNLTDGKQIKNRGMMIVRTEVARAATLGDYYSSLKAGATHFKIVSRRTACKLCTGKYTGRIFKISQMDMLPPYHPRCRCIALFFTDKKEADKFKVKEV